MEAHVYVTKLGASELVLGARETNDSLVSGETDEVRYTGAHWPCRGGVYYVHYGGGPLYTRSAGMV